jgi:hypothetical protein
MPRLKTETFGAGDQSWLDSATACATPHRGAGHQHLHRRHPLPERVHPVRHPVAKVGGIWCPTPPRGHHDRRRRPRRPPPHRPAVVGTNDFAVPCSTTVVSRPRRCRRAPTRSPPPSPLRSAPTSPSTTSERGLSHGSLDRHHRPRHSHRVRPAQPGRLRGARGTLARWLPNREVADIVVRFVKGSTGLVDVANFRAYDAEPRSARARRASGHDRAAGDRAEHPGLGVQPAPARQRQRLRRGAAGDIRDHRHRGARGLRRDRAAARVVLQTGKATTRTAASWTTTSVARPGTR